MAEPLEIATKGMFTRNVVLDLAGVHRGSRHVAWTAVDHYRYALEDWRKRGDFQLFDAHGTCIVAVEPIFDHWSLAAEYLIEALHPRLRGAPYYHPFAIEGDALVRPGLAPLPLAEIEHVELAAIGYAVWVFVHARGREWVRAGIGDIANLWLFCEDLVARGVAVRSELDFHLPPPLFPLVAQLAAARPLPVAKLVR